MTVLVEPLLIAWFGHDLKVDATTETPPHLEEKIPLVQVVRISGADDGFRLDRPLVDVDVFAATRLAAAQLADQARASLRRLRWHGVFGGAVVTDVATVTGPRWLPYDNTAVRRYGATYRLAVHPA